MKKKFFTICLMLIMFAVISINVFERHREELDSGTSTEVIASVIDIKNNSDHNNDVSDLKKAYNNDEVVGVLRIMNTDMKIPITQGKDNDKYLSTDAYGNYDKKGNPFLDYRVDINTSDKLLIYGHNSRNGNAPFKMLEKYYDKDYYDNHQYIELVTDSNVFRYKIFSVYVEPEDWSYLNIEYKDEVSRFKELERYKTKSMYDTDTEIDTNDDILILQTCSYRKEYSNYSKKFLLIISRRVK